MTKQTPTQDITYSLAASPAFANDGICFAARSSGLYRSQDGGKTWSFAYDELNLEIPLPTLDVAVSPAFETDQTVFAGVPGGILRSFDGGRNWRIATLPPPPPTVSALVISPHYARDGVLLAGTTEDGVFRSADRGERWAGWNFGLLDLSVFCAALSSAFTTDETLFVGTETGIFRSTNGGRAWREVGFPTDCAPVLCIALSPGYASDGTLYAGTESNGLFCSKNRGDSWSGLGTKELKDCVNGVILAPEFPRKPGILVALGGNLLVSRDGGESWSEWTPGFEYRQGLASVEAPLGLDPGMPLLVGMVEGGILQV